MGVENKYKTPTGRIPGTIMRFKIDKNLNVVAAAKVAPVDPETVAVELCARFIDAGMIEDTPYNYGVTVIQATGDKLVSDVCAVLAEYLYGDKSHSVPADVFDAFCAFIVMGEGDCPYCGGKLIYDDKVGHEIKDGNYDVPNSYVTDYYIYHCAICGEIIKSKKEL